MLSRGAAKALKAVPINLAKLTSSTANFALSHENRKYCLGEGVFWDHRYNRLLWVDITRGKLYSMNPENHEARRVDFDQTIGTVVPVEGSNDKVIVALAKGFIIVDLYTGECSSYLGNPEGKYWNLRWNEGKCDPQGRLWVGSMHLFGQKSNAGLWMIEADGTATRKLDATIANGIVWTSDRRTMYWNDSPTKAIKAYDYDEMTGEISNERVVVKNLDFFPDGMSIDTDDKLWVAMWGGWGVSRWCPDTGEELLRLDLPCSQVSACAFGGENLDQLYVSTAYNRLSPPDKVKQPLAGRLFKFDLSGFNIKGTKSNFFKWSGL